MAAAASTARRRRATAPASANQSASPSQNPNPNYPTSNQTPVSSLSNSHRTAAVWVIIGVPVVLVLALAWQLGSRILHTEIASRDAVSVGRVSLEAHPTGSRIDLVLVDRVGQETTVTGQVEFKLREPDGTLWRTSRSLTASDFAPLPDGGLLAGRVGYSIVVPAKDWVRAPRRGGVATVSVDVQPADGTSFSTVTEERFP